ncbi:MAG: DUF2723 domain-containing protein [Chloroflexi bacterium]|nr:DUF2723 domain-containing protein [Chloroflexota bacterium]
MSTIKKPAKLAAYSPPAAAACVALFALTIYLRTLAPGEVGGDAGEFQVVPYVLGIPHYTGYPLYTLLGWLWSHVIVVGTPAIRLNSLSAVFGAMTGALVFAVVRVMGGTVAASVIAGLTVAVIPLDWRWSTIAGVRAAAGTFTALLFLVMFRWGQAVRSGGSSSQTLARRWWLLLCLTFGLALAHHRSSMFFAGSLAVYAPFLPRSRPSIYTALKSVVLFVAPLLLYLYLPIRSALGAPYDQFHPTTWNRFVDLVFAPQLTRSLLSVPPSEWWGRALLLGETLRVSLGWLWPLGAIGLIGGALRRRPETLSLALFGALISAQVVNWNIGNELNVVYLIPVYVISAVFVGWGIESCVTVLAWVGMPRIVATSLVFAAGLVLSAQLARTAYTSQVASAHATLNAYHQHITAGWRGHRLITAALPYFPRDAVVAADWEQATIAWYAKLVSRTLPHIHIDFGNGSLSSLSYSELRKRYGDLPIVLGRSVPWAAGHHPSAVGPLIGLASKPRFQLPSPLVVHPVRFTGGFSLVGYQLFDERGATVSTLPRSSPILPVLLVWRADRTQTHNLSVSLRLLSNEGKVVRTKDRSSPVYGLAPTSTWAEGEVVADYYELSLEGLPHGRYTLDVLLYYQPKPGQFINLRPQVTGQPPSSDLAQILVITH